MFDFFVEHRARLGMKIYPAERGVTDRLVEAIEDGAVVAILGDRDLRGAGPEVEFFGERTTLPAGAASVALKAGVPVVIAAVYGERMPDGRRGWAADISAPIELPDEPPEQAVVTLTHAIGKALEGAIAKHPEEWHVFQPFWPADRAESA
jgi:KDO2-lipid IV(A) lauroyltransferase